jgi:hypothetical protein
MSAVRGATPAAPGGGMETPRACASAVWHEIESLAGLDSAERIIRARDEAWTLRVQQAHAQGWAEGRDAAVCVVARSLDFYATDLFGSTPAAEFARGLLNGLIEEARALLPPKARP